MTSISGRRRARARTAVDFAVPRWPRMRTPPMFGLIALRTSAVFIASCPTSAVNGMREREFGIDPIVPEGSSVETCYKASMPSPLRVLLEASCLADGRREAGIGRYTRQLADALQAIADLDVTES